MARVAHTSVTSNIASRTPATGANVARATVAALALLFATACGGGDPVDIAPAPAPPAGAESSAGMTDLYPGGDVSARTPVLDGD